MSKIWPILAGLILAGLSSCKTQSAFTFPEGKQVLFLDSLEAARRVSSDRVENFFDRITPLDMAIQMRESSGDQDTIRERYQEFLRRDVRSFTTAEKEKIAREIDTIYEWCRALSPHLLPDTLRLILTRGRNYDPGTWYTREDYIVIPEDALSNAPGPFQNVLLHELFHILSRRHPTFRKTLYGLIGFQRLEEEVLVPSPLQERLLLNPDGNDRQWAIALTDPSGTTTLALPLIYSRYETFQPSRPSFFAHLDFALFAIEQPGEGNPWQVSLSPAGLSTLGREFFVDYLRQVRNNTNYLIHPDEILADNFSLAVQGYQSEEKWESLSAEGRQLLQEIIRFLETWEGK